MRSRLLTTLLAEAKTTTNRIAWARAVCRAASHYARHGHTLKASNSILAVRNEFGSELDAEVAVWLMLAEGICGFFDMRADEAYERTKRAYAVARAIGAREAVATCAAWMAHLEFNACAYDSMVYHIEESLQYAENDDHQAGARVSLVLADAFHFAGAFQEARPWYMRCRLHATAEGDDATLSAMFHNLAAFHASNIRLSDAFGDLNPIEARRAWLEAESSHAFDAAIGGEGLHLLLPLLRGQILTVERKFDDALRMFRSIDTKHIHGRLIPVMHADISFCLAGLDLLEDAWTSAETAVSAAKSVTEHDDLAYLYARLAHTAQKCGREVQYLMWKEQSASSAMSHRGIQTNLLSRLKLIGPVQSNSEVFSNGN